MSGLTRARLRVPASAGAAFGWLLGLYVLPLLHNVGHRNDHVHGAEVAPSAHSHPHESVPEAPGGSLPIDTDHGSLSVLHFAAAALGAQAVDVPQPGLKAVLPAPSSPRDAPSTPRLAVLVRGPP
jgi:hypothetical protein